IESKKIDDAVNFLENWGLRVRLGKNVLKKYGPFAGDDKERLYDLQEMTNNRRIKAVFCSRGGYGLLRIIDKVDFSPLKKNPKWYVGFSDITVLHLWLNQVCGLVSVHGEMPVNYGNPKKRKETFESLHAHLFGNAESVTWKGNFLNARTVKGELTGGNLTLIMSLRGSPAEINTEGRILFIEEVGEYYYHLDRMVTSLKISGRLAGLSALVVGGLTRMKNKGVPWGKSAEDTIADAVREYGYPVLFGFPAGHIPDNRSLYIGREAMINFRDKFAELVYC
ncbi:MAG: LD-carboxypeptidase, partial [Bacteroidales bacterium]|nr:LD-carboxypeptidase [Bacteroidales bacterium]